MKHLIQIRVDELGIGTVKIDGHDVSDNVVAVGFNSETAQPTEVTLVLRNTSVDIEGISRVQAVLSKQEPVTCNNVAGTRYFVDRRNGCVAVRDRTRTNPDSPGLQPDTTGVVWYRAGEFINGSWDISPKVIDDAHAACAVLNRNTR